jgi:hypothetical protein
MGAAAEQAKDIQGPARRAILGEGCMRRALRSVTVIVLAIGLLVVASPAQADHVADLVGVDRSICRVGGIASGIGFNLRTTDFERVIRNGLTMSYDCRFANVPRYVSFEESTVGQEWSLPTETTTSETMGCWRPEFEGREEGVGRFTLYPNATARVVCRFADEGDPDRADLCTLTGTPGDDILRGTRGDDIICGLGGNDRLFGQGGNDELRGDDGNDQLNGSDGNDILIAGDGEDVLKGDDGNDELAGGTGRDRLSGGDRQDVLHGDDGNDDLYGNNGDDQLFGDKGQDRLYGDSGADQLYGSAGNDALNGGLANDECNGGADTDTGSACEVLIGLP